MPSTRFPSPRTRVEVEIPNGTLDELRRSADRNGISLVDEIRSRLAASVDYDNEPMTLNDAIAITSKYE